VTIMHLVDLAEITAAVVVGFSAVALLLMIPLALSACVRRRRSAGQPHAKKTVKRLLAAVAEMNAARADVDRFAAHAIDRLPEPTDLLRRTASELVASADALAAADEAEQNHGKGSGRPRSSSPAIPSPTVRQ